MQKLVEAKLKRVQQEGMAARSQAQAGGGLLQVTAQVAEGEVEDRGAVADANMAALLEQVQLEDQWSHPVPTPKYTTCGRKGGGDQTLVCARLQHRNNFSSELLPLFLADRKQALSFRSGPEEHADHES